MNHLERLLTASSAPRKLIVSDSLFSMDGDEAKLRELVTLKERHGALLVSSLRSLASLRKEEKILGVEAISLRMMDA